jgi:Holliday junction resolvasome RuvABC endonuclease subunit
VAPLHRQCRRHHVGEARAIKVLGLDLSLTGTGIVTVEDGVAGERWLIRTMPNLADMQRFDYVATEVIKRVFAGDGVFQRGVDLVAVEGVYASRNLLTFGRLTALSTCVQYALWRSKVPYVVLPPSAWRAAVFGKGSKIDKERIRYAVGAKLREQVGTMDVGSVDLNVLEAFLVGLAAWKMEVGEAPRPAVKKPRKKEVEE